MKNTWILTHANLLKSKSQTFNMFLLVAIAIMFFNIGLVLLFDVGSFFSRRAEELNTAHFIAVHHIDTPIEAGIAYIQNFPGFVAMEQTTVIYSFGGFYIGDAMTAADIFISPVTPAQTMNPATLIGDSLPLVGNAIYVPHVVRAGHNLNLGDPFRLNILGEPWEFTVAGSTEEILLGEAMVNMALRFYVSDEMFATLSDTLPETVSHMIAVQMTEGWFQLRQSYNVQFRQGMQDFATCYQMASNNRPLIPNIAAMVIVAFAFILLITAVIVVRFRIANDIEESMTNIGVLKATGFRNRQIVFSIVQQFGVIGLMGGLVGLGFSQLLVPVIALVIEPMLGLVWRPGANPVSMAISLVFALVLVLLFAYATARRINKLHPLIALRGGLTTHNFKRNFLPLEKTPGFLGLLLAVKHVLGNKKQAVALCIIIFTLTFSATSVGALRYNLTVNRQELLNVLIGELAPITNTLLVFQDANHREEMQEIIAAHPDVAHVFSLANVSLMVEDAVVNFEVVENTDFFHGVTIIEGRMPVLSTEVVLCAISAEATGSAVGDWVSISHGEYEVQFIVTGINQIFGGMQGVMGKNGVREVMPDYNPPQLIIGLHEGACEDAVMADIALASQHISFSVVSFNEQMDGIFGAMDGVLTILTIAIVFVVAGVVVLVLYLMVKTMIIRRRRELGVQKALGFTTLQLMNQIALGLTPAVLIGAVTGAWIGAAGFSNVFLMIARGMGVVQINFAVPVVDTVVIATGLVILAYVVSMAIAWRIRKISAYVMVVNG